MCECVCYCAYFYYVNKLYVHVCVLERAKHSFFALPSPLSCSVMNMFKPNIRKELGTAINATIPSPDPVAFESLWYKVDHLFTYIASRNRQNALLHTVLCNWMHVSFALRTHPFSSSLGPHPPFSLPHTNTSAAQSAGTRSRSDRSRRHRSGNDRCTLKEENVWQSHTHIPNQLIHQVEATILDVIVVGVADILWRKRTHDNHIHIHPITWYTK